MYIYVYICIYIYIYIYIYPVQVTGQGGAQTEERKPRGAPRYDSPEVTTYPILFLSVVLALITLAAYYHADAGILIRDVIPTYTTND